MFEEIKTESYFRRLRPMISRRHVRLLALAILLLVPFPTTVIPEWKLRIVDEAGSPYAGMEVSQAWKHYSLELEGGENMETLQTDGGGYATFPKRTFWAGLLSRALRIAFTAAMTIAHGSTGVHADVSATGPQGTEYVRYEAGKPLPRELVLRR